MCVAVEPGYGRAMSVDAHPPLLGRVRPWQWVALDCAAGLVVVAVWSAPLLTGRGDGPPDAQYGAFLGLLGATLLGVPLALRRFRPVWTFALALPAFGLTLATSVVPVVPLASVPMALIAYSLAVQESRRVAACALGTVVVVVMTATSVWSGAWAWPQVTVLLPGAVVVIGWVVGALAAQHRAYARALRTHQERETGDLVQRTVTEERLRIARELHDVVAHGMSVITVQADMGRLVLDRKPDVAGTALGVIETTGRETLTELRRMLGVLRQDGAADGVVPPAPGLDGLDGLLARTTAAGIELEVSVRGAPRPLPAGVDLSAYRIVQEALTNVVKHAGARHCRVGISYEAGAVRLSITDDGRGGPAKAAGHGLVGMRERARLCGGELLAGPSPDGGFEVTARLPDEAAR